MKSMHSEGHIKTNMVCGNADKTTIFKTGFEKW